MTRSVIKHSCDKLLPFEKTNLRLIAMGITGQNSDAVARRLRILADLRKEGVTCDCGARVKRLKELAR